MACANTCPEPNRETVLSGRLLPLSLQSDLQSDDPTPHGEHVNKSRSRLGYSVADAPTLLGFVFGGRLDASQTGMDPIFSTALPGHRCLRPTDPLLDPLWYRLP